MRTLCLLDHTVHPYWCLSIPLHPHVGITRLFSYCTVCACGENKAFYLPYTVASLAQSWTSRVRLDVHGMSEKYLSCNRSRGLN